MLSSRWTTVAAPDSAQSHCSVVAVQLTLRTARAGPIVDAWAGRIADALPTGGLLGVMLDRTDTHLRMVSAWARRTDLAEFERGPMHRGAKDALRDHVLPPTVAVWTEVLAALPPDWHEVQRRLDAARARQCPDGAAPSASPTPRPPDSTPGRTTP